jgi:HPt (histidine-containing phosphotransfer) domain-containing protein
MSEENENFDISKFTAGDKFFGQMKEAGVADNDFIREIVEMFLKECAVSVKIIREGFENNDLDTIHLYAHKLKSSFLMFDMHEAHALAIVLEGIDKPLIPENKTLTELEALCNKSFKMLTLKYLG